MSGALTVRPATVGDVEAITEIYNEAIATTTATLDIEPKSIGDRRKWLEKRSPRYPVLVAEADGLVVGWTSLSAWSEREGYAATAETALYVRATHRNQGIGRRLKSAIIETARDLGFENLLVRVTTESEVSVHLNEAFGFERVGTLRSVGSKFGRLLDVLIMQKTLR